MGSVGQHRLETVPLGWWLPFFSPQIRRMNYISHLSWEHLGIHQEDLEDKAREKKV